MVTFQFAITLIILVGLVVVTQQLEFVQSKDLGYDRENLLILRVNGSEQVKKGYSAFKNDLKAHSSVVEVARSGSMITGGLGNSNGQAQREDGETQFEKLYRLSVGYDYLNTYGIQLLAGRDFSREIGPDSTEAFIVNKKAAAAFGWSPEEAIDKKFMFSGREGKIVGVTEDFHFNSLRTEIGPVCMYIQRNFSRITVKGKDSQQMLTEVKKAWQAHFPSAIFDYTFQDQALFNSYEHDRRFGKIVKVFSILSMLIAFLGLFGLVGYTVSRKTKEIGIRKVLGASGAQIGTMISGNFLRLIIIAAVVAFPVAWWIMLQWLSEFPYRIDMEVWFFIGAAGFVLLMAFSVIFAQTLKTSLANPVEALKEE